MTPEKSIKILKAAKMLKDDAIGTLIDTTDAYKMAIEALSKQSGGEQANESVIVNFVAFQRKWLKAHKIMELNSADEVMTEIFLKETGKAFIDSLGQSGENDEADQFRDDTKKTDFKPGDKFILELGTERKMFGEFEFKGTDLYVKTDLLEKLTRYEPGENPGNLGENPGIIRCNACKYWIQTVGRMQGYGLGKCDFHDANLVNCNGFCYWAERRNDG